jgi:hypothetical protein
MSKNIFLVKKQRYEIDVRLFEFKLIDRGKCNSIDFI